MLLVHIYIYMYKGKEHLATRTHTNREKLIKSPARVLKYSRVLSSWARKCAHCYYLTTTLILLVLHIKRICIYIFVGSILVQLKKPRAPSFLFSSIFRLSTTQSRIKGTVIFFLYFLNGLRLPLRSVLRNNVIVVLSSDSRRRSPNRTYR
jgi:hypothetical protein